MRSTNRSRNPGSWCFKSTKPRWVGPRPSGRSRVSPDEQLALFNRLLVNYENEPSELARPELRRRALDRAVLLHARLLEEGLETEARRVARQAIERIGPESGPALIAGTLVVRQARPWHTELLPDDGTSSRLAGHLQKALEDARMPESDELRTIRIGE